MKFLSWFKKKSKKQRHASQRREFLLPSRQNVSKSRARNRLLLFWANLKETWSIRKKFRWIWLLYLALVSMAVVVGLSLATPYFKLKKITVIRSEGFLHIEQIEEKLKPYKNKNLLFLRTTSLEKLISDSFPEFETVSVQEVWPDEITVRVGMAAPILTLKNSFDATNYALSSRGVVLATPPVLPPNEITLTQYEKPIKQGQKILTEDEMNFIAAIDDLVNEFLPAKSSGKQYLWAAQELHLQFDSNFTLWLDVNQPPTEQIEKLLSAKDELKLFEKPYQYLDLRIPGHIYSQ